MAEVEESGEPEGKGRTETLDQVIGDLKRWYGLRGDGDEALLQFLVMAFLEGRQAEPDFLAWATPRAMARVRMWLDELERREG